MEGNYYFEKLEYLFETKNYEIRTSLVLYVAKKLVEKIKIKTRIS